MRQWIVGCVMGAFLATNASCGTSDLHVFSQVTVDGAPMETGTIRLEPLDNGKGAGGSVEAGVMTLTAEQKLAPGRYRVQAQGFRKSGRTVADPERGPVPEMVPLVLRNSPHEIEISRDNAQNLTIDFTTAQR